MNLKYLLFIGLICCINSQSFDSLNNWSHITVRGPYELKQLIPDAITGSDASFGYNPLGKTMIGNLHVADPIDACTPVKAPKYTEEYDYTPIMIVERGNCSFVTKAYHAQFAGADLVLIKDNKKGQDVEHIIMWAEGDDGLKITVPVVLIGDEEGDKLINFVKNKKATNQNSEVTLQVVFPYEIPKTTVTVEMWMSSDNEKSYEMINQLKNIYDAFDGSKNLHLRPHYYVSYDPEAARTGFNGSATHGCLSGGRYCAPNYNGNGVLTNEEILYEDLRQICIRDEYGIDPWFDYVQKFHLECLSKKEFWTNECYRTVLKDVKYDEEHDGNKNNNVINVDWVNMCVENSFIDRDGVQNSDPKKGENLRLKEEFMNLTQRFVYTYPEIIINGLVYRGNVEEEYLKEAICQGLEESVPNYEKYCGDSFAILDIPNKKLTLNYHHSYFWLMVVIVFILIVVCCLGFYWFCHQKITIDLRKDRDYQIDNIISQEFQNMTMETQSNEQVIDLNEEIREEIELVQKEKDIE